MEAGPSSQAATKGGEGRQRGRPKPGPWPATIDPFVPHTDHNPRELGSWAKRTGFNPKLSGETTTSSLSRIAESAAFDLEKGDSDLRRNGQPPKPEIEPTFGRARAGIEISPLPDSARAEGDAEHLGFKEKRRVGIEPAVRVNDETRDNVVNNGNGNGGHAAAAPSTADEDSKDLDVEKGEREGDIDPIPYSQDPKPPSGHRPAGFTCGLTENPGFAHLIYYGVQHYLSLAGSLVFIPIIMVPVMGGTDEETATVISTMLLVSGLTTIMHSFFGTRLPLVQGSSFVFLAPALVITNSEEFRNLSENKFRHIMRELQGAIIIGSFFQIIMGYSGFISLLIRLINPVVVAPTVAAVGLAFFSYGFPQAGACVEISIPQILLVLVFTLYLRRVSLFGHRIFLVYAVPLSVSIVWAYAFFLTAGGAYNKGCSSNIPSSNILLDACRRHADTIRHCRTDVSNAWRTAAWVRVPYPFQWGSPTFHFKTSIIMIIVSLVASVDSVGSYHATSILINLRPPSPGIVSRGVGLEGCSSLLAGLWGTGMGATTLTENVHTLDATKMASRKAIGLGAILMIVFSFVGKVGALLASIPLALAASVLCFTWALIIALGLSTLRYTQAAASSRNIIIVGFTIFISLSAPAYFQQYQPNSNLVLPSYLVPYSAASSGPVHTGNKGLDYALNSILSLNMVVALVVAFVLDNTVPGSKQERGVYIWSAPHSAGDDPSSLEPYSLPERMRCFFRWAKCVGS